MTFDNLGPPEEETPQGRHSPGDATTATPALTKTSTTPVLNGAGRRRHVDAAGWSE